MKHTLTLVLALWMIFYSCTEPAKKTPLLHRDNLPLVQYTITTNKDTTIQTPNGALVKIPKNALSGGDGGTVTLEIKEAFTLEQMIKGGLLTRSNGQPLSSGGMIYINAVGGRAVTIRKPIQVSLPTAHLDSGMQLYKGEVTTDGSINWVAPQPLPQTENSQLTSISRGRALYQQNCQSCHGIGHLIIAPDLAHFPKRFDSAEQRWRLYRQRLSDVWKSDTSEFPNGQYDVMLNSDNWHLNMGSDTYLCTLIRQFGSVGPSFPALTRTDWDDIYRYVQNESDRRSLPLPEHAYLLDCVDSCDAYLQTVQELKAQKRAAASKRSALIQDNGSLVEQKPDSTWGTSNAPPVNIEDKVDGGQYNAVYYQFTIESFGWYNIDMLLNRVDGVEESELFVRIVGQYREKVKVYLVIPSVKVYGEGGPTGRGDDEYAFYYKTGILPLPQNVKAYVLAVTEREESIAFALKEFTTGRQQVLDVALHAATKEAFTGVLQQFDRQGLHIGVHDAKNAEEIRNADARLRTLDQQLQKAQSLKPKRCDCHCGEEGAVKEEETSYRERTADSYDY